MATSSRFTLNGVQLKPCIMAKARHALGVTDKQPTNRTRCGEDYWAMTVRAMAAHHGVTSEATISEATKKYADYIK
ncbi:hypothetical protein [Hymenobacter fodinae]|uniref:Uncharacterized protein n=1 Tax=Hymenobacter fodinae TaxID=2510796 RepID=A0A4Z0P0Z7_9BACT|nr:hypothetical protein [Hymenobacter fodinae]TGE04601.1 hypothetical protein EU556_20670 [Hymenobacter fodinae]